MRKSRIIFQNGKFIIQRKIAFFWMTDKVSYNDGEVVEARSFRSLEDAQAYINGAKPNSVITEKMVSAVLPYINGSLPLDERKSYARSAIRAALAKEGE